MIKIGQYDCVRIGSKEMRVRYRDHDGYVLERCDDGSGVHESFSHEQIKKLNREGTIRIDRDWFAENNTKARLFSNISYQTQIPTDERDYIEFKEELVKAFIRKRAHDKSVKMTDAGIKAILEIIQMEAREHARKKDPSRCDRVISSRNLPSSRTFRRWLKSYREHGYDTLSLRNRKRFCGNREKRIHPMANKILPTYVFAYCSETQPTYAKLHGQMEAEFAQFNVEREKNGMAPLACPSKATLRTTIGSLNQFEVMACRKGLEAAQHEFRIVGPGMDITRPLQHAQIDEWMVQMHTLVDALELGDVFTEEDRSKLAKERLRICVIIDVATRCILAVTFFRSFDASIAVATLQMAVEDKNDVARTAGCESDWPMAGAISQISADTGSQFIAEEFRRRCSDLKTDYTNAPAGISYLRGHIERTFSSMHMGLMPDFTGRTFSNVVEKGKYDSENRASIFSSDLPNIIVRWIVDVYHHRPHAGLGGQTPYCAWKEKLKEYGVNPPPNPHQIREVFGIDADRQLGPRGIRVNGIDYQSTEIQEFRRQAGTRKLTVRFNPQDLGWISTLINGRWVTIPATKSETYRGVSLDEWRQATLDLKRKYTEETRLSAAIVRNAIRAIRQIAKDAPRRVGIESTRPTPEEIDRAENKLHLGFEIVDDESDTGDGTPGDLLSGGISVPEAGTTKHPQPQSDPPSVTALDESPESAVFDEASEFWIED